MPFSSPLHKPHGRPSGRTINDAFYSMAPWRRFREWFLARHPLCCDPWGKHHGAFELATDVDHIIPRRERPELTFTELNCQALCHGCHSIKTRRGA